MRRSRELLGVVLALCVLLSGCAWMFQDHEPQPYIPNHEPRCTTSPGWWMVDGVSVPFDVGFAIAERNDSAVLAINLAGLVIDVASMVTGIVWASACRDARAQYDARPGQLPQPVYVVRPRDAASSGHGWFCASSPNGVGLCTRDLGSCATARDAAASAGGEPGACRLAKTAWCFDLAAGGVRCFPSQDGCTSTIARAGADAMGECEERR